MGFKEQFRFIWQYAVIYKQRLVGFTLVSLLLASMQLTTPFLYGKITDVAIGRSEFFNLQWWQIAIITFTIIAILALLNRFLDWGVANNSDRLRRDFIIDMCDHVVRLFVGHYHNQKPGTTFKILDRSNGALTEIIHMLIIDFFPGFLGMTGALIWVFFLHQGLGLIMLFTVVVYSILSFYYKMPKILACQDKNNKLFNEAYGNIGDMLANFFAVKTNTAENFETNQRVKEFDVIIPDSFRINRLWFDYNLAQSVIMVSCRVAIIVISIYLLKNKEITEGDLLAFILYTGFVFNPMHMINRNIRRLRRLLVDVQDAMKLKEEVQEDDLVGAEEVTLHGKIEFKNVSFSYNGDDGVLKNVNLVIPAGKVFAIMGQTGVGKSTLTNLILRLFETTQGQILFDGIDSQKIKRSSLRSQIAVVPQDPVLFHDSLLANIRYSKPDATFDEVVAAAKIANAHEFIMAKPNGYDSIVGERGVKLSGGERQRIAIARAALRNPRILILDEATKDLDISTKDEVLAALQNVIAGRTVIVITHDFSSITSSADNIIVLDGGNISQQGKHSQLVEEDGTYRNYWLKLMKTLGIA